MNDDEQSDFDDPERGDDPYGPAVDLIDVGRGELDGTDADTCMECGSDLLDAYTGEGGGGMLCSDCNDLSDPTDLEW